jgi:serine/threonine protein kinase
MPDEATAKSVDWLTLADQQRFDVLEQLGEGGVATVYKAFDRQSDRPVALKVLHRSSLQLARSDSAILAGVGHPHASRASGGGASLWHWCHDE